jgi:hypothetical protein
MRLSRILLLGLFLAAVPSSAPAHTLEAPASIMAASDGSFSYPWRLTVGPDSALAAGSGYDAGDNVTGSWHGDCLCHPDFCWMKPGQTIEMTVVGVLNDPASPGTVWNWAAFCGEPDVVVETTVLPFDPSPARKTTWGRLKVLYL